MNHDQFEREQAEYLDWLMNSDGRRYADDKLHLRLASCSLSKFKRAMNSRAMAVLANALFPVTLCLIFLGLMVLLLAVGDKADRECRAAGGGT